METPSNGEFPLESGGKDSVEDKTINDIHNTLSNSAGIEDSAVCLDEEKSSNVLNSDSVLPHEPNVSIQDENLATEAKKSDCDGVIKELDLPKNILYYTESSFTESNVTENKVVDPMELLKNSVKNISASLNKSDELCSSLSNDKADSIKKSVCMGSKNKSDFDESAASNVNICPEERNKETTENSKVEFEDSRLKPSNSSVLMFENKLGLFESSPNCSANKDKCEAMETDDFNPKTLANNQNSAFPLEQTDHSSKSIENYVDLHNGNSLKHSASYCQITDKIEFKDDAHKAESLTSSADSSKDGTEKVVSSKISADEMESSKDSADKMEPSKEGAASQERDKESDSFVFTELSNEETGFPDVFTDLVTIGKYISVKGDFTLRSTEALVESASLIAPYLLKEPDTFPPRVTPLKNDSRGFFYSTAGEFLIGIGLSRVGEWYHRDMARIKKRQMKKEGKSPELEEDLNMHESFYLESRKANRMYSFPLKSCRNCGFATESSIVLEGHLLVPHTNARREFQCNYCDVINRDPRALLEHMYRIHNKSGRIQPPTFFFECPYCTFETNSKVKLGNHLSKCQRFYDPNRNQNPPKDFEFPALTPKPITVAVVKAYEKSLNSMQRGRGRPKKMDSICDQLNQFSSVNQSPIAPNSIPPYRPSSTPVLSESLSNLTNQLMSPMQMTNISLRPPPNHSGMNQFRPALPSMNLANSNRLFHVVNSSAPMMPMMGNNSYITSQSQFPFSPTLVNSGKKLPTHSPNFLGPLFGTGLRQQNPPKNSSEVTITPLPKLQGPYPVPHVKTSTPLNNTSMQGNSLVVCEICDGYIKDLEQLRSHMQLIHKVKIHPKMLVSRPPLNCQKCQWRFFTDQGLERHLLGSHGLVTSNMQELANKGKDAGCCTICGRVYASKLVSHMNQVHKLTLKPAHLSYKCTVCSATFNLYRLFENHVYLVHSGAAKRSSDNSSNPSKKFKSSDMDGAHFDGEVNNHAERTVENSIGRCKECGEDFPRMTAQSDRCQKCLNFDRPSVGNNLMS